MTKKDTDAPTRQKVGDRVTVVRRGARGIYQAEYSERNVHRRVSLKTHNFKVARTRALALEAKLASGEFEVRPKVVPLAGAITDYLAVKKTDNRAHKTLVKYRTELETFAGFAATRNVRTLQQISPSLFDQYRAWRADGRSDKSRYTEAIIIKGFVKWCQLRSLIDKDPLQGCKLGKPAHLPKMTPTLEQVNALLAAAKGERQVHIATLAFTGMRSGELQMLRPGDVDIEGGWIHVLARVDWRPKNRQSRKIPIHPRLRDYLLKVKKSNRPHFFCAAPSPRYPEGGHKINTKHLNESVQALARKLGLPTGRKNDGLVVHSLRHFFETHCVNMGIPQHAIDTWMGHTGDKSMAAIYYNLGDKESQTFMSNVPF